MTSASDSANNSMASRKVELELTTKRFSSVSRYSRTSSAVSGSSSTWSTLIGCSRRAVVPELGAVWVASSFSMQSWVSCMVMISVGGGKVREENFEAVNVSIGLAETVELLSMIWNKERVEAARSEEHT